MNLHHHQQRKLSDSNRLPPISVMDDFLPTRTWAPPLSSSLPESSSLTPKSSSLPTPPQPDQWKSPPYVNRNELSRDTSYTYYNSNNNTSNTSPLLLSSTSPILRSPQQQQGAPESPNQQQQLRSPSYFQYTSRAYNTNSSVSPSSSYNNLTYAPNRVENDIEEVVRQCNNLCENMIQRKGQIINSHSGASTYQDLTSTRPWLDDMIGRANEVLNALLRLRKHQIASEQLRSAAANTSDHYHNEYTANEHRQSNTWRIGSSPASSNAVNNNGNNNSIRQRKRGKRPAFQGRCHSCNIESTPEWRRGPDGARTLCNACGLHYAKLARKQQENLGMSSNNAGILGSSSPTSSRRLGSNSNASFSPSPPADEIILDRSPTG